MMQQGMQIWCTGNWLNQHTYAFYVSSVYGSTLIWNLSFMVSVRGTHLVILQQDVTAGMASVTTMQEVLQQEHTAALV